MAIDLTGRVAIVTGAGAGLGREHALELARRGAKVIVNDLGTSMGGEGRSSEAAEKVVAEIEAAGGTALANGGSVSETADMRALAQQALDAFGRIDILVANAGILRDTSFKKMTVEDYALVINVHLLGTARAVKAVWDSMCAAGYGRIVFTTSTSGLFGNFGQANYASAKSGLIGLMNVLTIEGAKYDVKVNSISPFAATRMSEAHIPPSLLPRMHPRYVAAGVAFLASEQAPSSTVLNAGAGFFSTTRYMETEGLVMPIDEVSAESIAESFGAISDETKLHGFDSANDQAVSMYARASITFD